MRPVGRSLLLARHASEDASGGQEAVHSLWSRLFCGPLKMRRVPQKGVFVHRISLPYQKSLFFTPSASENASRTTGGCFEHRVSIPYRRRAFPVPNAHSVCPCPIKLNVSVNYKDFTSQKCQFSQKDRVRGMFLNEKPLTDHSVRGFKCSLRDSNPRHPD